MKISTDQFFEAFQKSLDRNDSECKFISPPPEYTSWLKEQSIPNQLKEFLIKACFEGEEYDVGTVDFWPWERIVNENHEFNYILKGGFLIFGSAGNGDMVGVDWGHEPGRVGFLSHDDLWLWDEEEYPDPNEHFLSVSKSIGEFALVATDFSSCPLDYYGTMANL